MKLLLLMLLAANFNLSAQTIHCGTKTIAEVDACSVEDKLPQMLVRLFPSLSGTTKEQYNAPDPCDPLTIDNPDTQIVETCPVWDKKTDKFYYEPQVLDANGLPTLTLHNRLVMLNKPSLSSLGAELASWKAQIKVKINWDLRIDSISRMRRSMGKCGYNIPNMAIFNRDLKANLNDVRVTCLESKIAELDAEDIYQAKRVKRKKDRAFGDSLVEEILILIPDTLAPAAKLDMLAKLTNIQSMLQLGDIDGSKLMIIAEPIDANFTQAIKDFLISKINVYLGV